MTYSSFTHKKVLEFFMLTYELLDQFFQSFVLLFSDKHVLFSFLAIGVQFSFPSLVLDGRRGSKLSEVRLQGCPSPRKGLEAGGRQRRGSREGKGVSLTCEHWLQA